MNRLLLLAFGYLVATCWTHPLHHPFDHVYPLAYPYSELNYGQVYAPQMQTYTQQLVKDYRTTVPEIRSTLNLLAEVPYTVSNQFSVVPLWIVSKDTMDTTVVSSEQPVITVKVTENGSIASTPAVRMVLDKPIIVGSLKSNVLFPSEVQLLLEGRRIPLKIGAVLAPVLPETYVSQETPISVRVVYAIPTKPLKITIKIEEENSLNPVGIHNRFPETQALPNPGKPAQFQPTNPFGALSTKPDYINNDDASLQPDQEAVVVEREQELPPKNITVIDFPDKEAEPQLQVDEEDDELINRNPPQVLAPAGIVQSTQPETHVEAFHNDKESPYLEVLREEAKKKRI